MESTFVSNNAVIQSLLQRADEVANMPFALNSPDTVDGQEQYSTLNSSPIENTMSNGSFNLGSMQIEEVDEETANQIIRSLSPPIVYPSHRSIDTNNTANAMIDQSTLASRSTGSYQGEVFRDPNGPQIIRRPPAHGPLTYQQNISVRFLQPPPVPPPGPLIIKEVRPPQPPTPPPLVLRQRAPPLPTPPPLILRERPPQRPPPIPTQTIIRNLPAIPVSPRSIIVEQYPPIPPRPRDIIVERWIPYSREPQRRKIITHRAPPPRPYPQPHNIVIVYEPVQVNVIRSVRRLGVQSQNPKEYIYRYGHCLLDSPTLVAQARQVGVTDDLGPPLSSYNEQYQTDDNVQYYVSTPQTVWEPKYEYSTNTMENQTVNHQNPTEIYWTDPQEDIHTILQRLGLAVE